VEHLCYSIENKVFQGDNNIIVLKQQLFGIILCFFMHLKWLRLLRFFGEML
jgi:flagellar biosynthesis protein FliR